MRLLTLGQCNFAKCKPRLRHTDLIRAEAQRLGFGFVGFARAERLDEEARHLEQWLNAGAHGRMAYMENYFDLRIDPTQLVPSAKTVICLTFNYFTDEKQQDPAAPKIATYAYGEDYHYVVKDRLKNVVAIHARRDWGDRWALLRG